ncbi:MAG: hypothetical protein MI747_09380 [Desulfobacterales bacterium]|nr:hypothetical protein [Desulfobacterales bacterium]
MISWIYWAINLLVILLVARCVWKADSFRNQLAGALVMVPLLLRAFFIK